ncbi:MULTISPECIES: M48 family metallopeptidase [Alicyclobacillus]|nr:MULTISPECIES: SprT family zinc-dependent metalloprotease [Alicyclobacillus]
MTKANAKRITLRFHTDGQLLAISHPSVSQSVVEEVIRKQANWIQKTRSHLLSERDRTYYRLQSGEQIQVCGKNYKFIVQPSHQDDPLRLKVDKDEHLTFFIPEHTQPEELAESARQLLIQWLRKKGSSWSTMRAEIWESRMNVKSTQIRVKEQKTRWGSCSSQGNINLNWRIFLAPLDVIDYVLVHELAHLLEMNHSDAFWRIVKSHLPHYQECIQWLNHHGRSLDVQLIVKS